MAAVKKLNRRRFGNSNWGGKRAGAGRPKGIGKVGPDPDSRMYRVAVMLDRHELKALKRRARMLKVPVATAAYQICARSLAR